MLFLYSINSPIGIPAIIFSSNQRFLTVERPRDLPGTWFLYHRVWLKRQHCERSCISEHYSELIHIKIASCHGEHQFANEKRRNSRTLIAQILTLSTRSLFIIGSMVEILSPAKTDYQAKYPPVIETLQGIAWMLLVFFAFALIASVIVRIFESRKPRQTP